MRARGWSGVAVTGVLVAGMLAFGIGCGGGGGGKKRRVADVQIVTPSLPDGSVGSAYDQTVAATGGLVPYSWSISTGTLPPGLALASATGAISGTPTTLGTFPFDVTVTDAQGNPSVDTRSYTISIGSSVTITTSGLATGTEGVPYSDALAATGGQPPYTWAVTSGSLPAGVTLAPDGVLGGTPTAPGLASFTVTVTDSQASPSTDSAALTIQIFAAGPNNPPIVSLGIGLGPHRGLVEMVYKLLDDESDPATITIEYSTDGGSTFAPATSGPGGQGLGPHVTMPTTLVYMFQWNSTVDLPGTLESNVVLRLTAFDAQPGTPDLSGVITIDNRPDMGLFARAMGSLQEGRYEHTATVLGNDEVLIVGGRDSAGLALDTAELYSPVTGLFTTVASTLTDARYDHTATLLPNGNVLIAGGFDDTSQIASAEVYDAVAGTFSPTGSLSKARGDHAAASDGAKAYVFGGVNAVAPAIFDDLEPYDPVGGIFEAPVTMAQARADLTANALAGGNILLVGGSFGDLSAEEYDPGSGTSPITHTLGGTADLTFHATAVLTGGLGLVTGGTPTGPTITNALDTAYTYDSTTGFASVGPMSTSRRRHTTTALANGDGLIAGGEDNNFVVQSSADIYDPVTGLAPTRAMNDVRMSHAAVLMADGRILVIGGTSDGSTPVRSAEFHNP